MWIVTTFTLFSAALAVFLAVPMKRQMINYENHPLETAHIIEV